MMVTDPSWPAELQGHMFVGNVMTSRLNHDAIEWRGASSKGKELPDFLTADDPWFRPVDLQWGPDGALYIADFYNRIIGHYEVPLLHPGRDRERGRLWRVVYRGKGGSGVVSGALPGDPAGLVKELASTNPTRRSLALNELCDRLSGESVPLLKQALTQPVNGFQTTGALWALQRLNALEAEALLAGLKHADPLVRTHATRVADLRKEWTPALAEAVRAGLSDADAIVRRVTTEALGSHPVAENFRPLLDLVQRVPKEDDHLAYSARVALRDHLRVPSVAGKLSLDAAKPEELRALLDIMLGVQGEQTALLRLSLFERIEVPADQIAKQLPSMVKNLPAERLSSVVKLGRKHLANDIDAQAAVLKNLAEVYAQRGLSPDEAMRTWGGEVAMALLATKKDAGAWTASALDGSALSENPWTFQERACADGEKAQVMSSFPRGEKLTGVLRSAAFVAPEKLRFYLCGHDGVTNQPPAQKNFVRLRDEADGKVLRSAAPPRNDTAQRIEWDLKEFAGKRVYFEVTDGDTGDAYAWLAFGRFKPELPQLALVEPATIGKRQALGADLARSFGHKAATPRVIALFSDGTTDELARAATARALVALEPGKGVELVAKELGNSMCSMTLREKLAGFLGSANSDAAEQSLLAVLPAAPHKLQQAVAAALSTTKGGATRLLNALSEGKASATLLRDRALVDRLRAQHADAAARIASLTANLPPANAEADRLIAARRSSFDPAKADANRGATAFTQYCAVCHQIGQKGNLVGPQLDGIGARGLDRILEDVVDPNRNVDRAFRMSVVTLNDGGVVSGLFRREEGATLVFADLTGKEQSVPKASVKARTESETSLMPPTLIEAIPAKEFADLLAFLLAQKATH
jgi:putative heme-binding domain-containing protein